MSPIQKLKAKILCINIIIPLIFMFSYKAFSQLFNPAIDISFWERILLSVEPKAYIMFLVMDIGFTLWLMHYSAPLYTYMETGKDYMKARITTIRLPLYVMAAHIGFWALGTTIFRIALHGAVPGNTSYPWMLVLFTNNGLQEGLFTATAMYIVLTEAKKQLKATSIEPNEKDLFLNWINPLSTISLVLSSIILMAYATAFFTSHKTLVNFDPPVVFTLFLIGLFCGGISIGLNRIITYIHTTQFKFIKSKIDSLCDGNVDLSQRIHLINFDHTGELAASMNHLLEFLSKMIHSVKGATVTSEEFAYSLEEIIRKSDASIREYNKTFQQMLDSINHNQNDMNIAEYNAGEIMTGLGDYITHMESQVQAIDQIAMSITDMSESLIHTINSVSDSSRLSDEVREISKENAAAIRHYSNIIESIKMSTDTLSKSIRKITDISETTGLISINSTIEAAHAGEYGRGFAVVAQEIRKLSTETYALTEEIMKQIYDINQRASDGLVTIHNLQISFEKIQPVFERTINKLETFVEELRGNRQEAISTIDSASILRDSMFRFKEMSEQQMIKGQEVIDVIRKLIKTSFDNQQSLQTIQSQNDEILENQMHALDASNENRNRILQLRTITGSFHTTEN